MKYIVFNLCLLFVFASCKTQAQNTSEIQWMDFKEAISIQKEDDKKIFLFIYTDWCDFCNYTKETLLKHQDFVDAVNNNFIPVRFNAEQTETVDFMGHELGIQEESGYHYLPIILMEGKMEFPGFVFLNTDGKIISKQSGVKENIEEFTDYTNYIGTDAYLTEKWLDYNPQ